MAQRCAAHNTVEPCLYCKRNIAPFHGWRDRVEALEQLFIALEKAAPLADQRGMVSPNPDVPLKNFDISQATAVIRDVGIGDIVMLAPALRALKEKNPSRPLVFVTKPENFEVLAGATYLDAIFPIDSFDPEPFREVHDLCLAVETIENGGKLKLSEYLSKPRTQVFAELLGVADMPLKFGLQCHEGALAHMRGYVGHLKRPLIGLAPTCRSPLRVMPPDYVEDLARLLTAYRGTVILMGKTESWNKQLGSIRMKGLTNFIDRLSIKDLIALIYLMDAMIAPNTGTLHIAGSMGVKTLALEGNNDPKIFVNVYPSTKAVQPRKGELPCIPCGDQRRTCALKPGRWGAECMQLLTPERIYGAFQSFYNGRNVAFVRDITVDHVGGAEITDKITIRQGLEKGYNVRVFDNSKTAEELYEVFNYDLIVVSNCWLFDPVKLDIVMKAIRKVPFIKFEHDHRSIDRVVAGKFPREEYSARLFGESVFNVFVSPEHLRDYRKNLGVNGICIFPPMDVDLYRPVPGIKRQPNTALLGVPRKANMKEFAVRGNTDLLDYRKAHPQVKLHYMDKVVPPDKMPEVYSAYEYFVHLPIVKWSCERVIFEAALCGCKVVTNDNAEGVSWGQDLDDPERLRAWIKAQQYKFWQAVEEKIFRGENDAVPGDRRDSLRRMPSGQIALAAGA